MLQHGGGFRTFGTAPCSFRRGELATLNVEDLEKYRRDLRPRSRHLARKRGATAKSACTYGSAALLGAPGRSTVPPIQSRAVAKKAQDRKIAGYFIFPACVHIKTDV